MINSFVTTDEYDILTFVTCIKRIKFEMHPRPHRLISKHNINCVDFFLKKYSKIIVKLVKLFIQWYDMHNMKMFQVKAN